MRVLVLLVIVCITLGTSCTQDGVLPNSEPHYDCTENCIEGNIKTIAYSSSPVQVGWSIVDTAYIENTILNVEVLYSGGCQEHCWELIWRGEVNDVDSAKAISYFTIDHCKPIGACDELIKKHLAFDIGFLNELDTTGTIIISIDPALSTEESYDLPYHH